MFIEYEFDNHNQAEREIILIWESSAPWAQDQPSNSYLLRRERRRRPTERLLLLLIITYNKFMNHLDSLYRRGLDKFSLSYCLI